MNWRAVLRLAAFALLVVAIAPLQWVLLRLHRGPHARLLSRAFHRAACRIFGLRVESSGAPSRGRTVFAANHLSHLDVMVLGSLLDASFVAKDKIDGWPVLGWLTRAVRPGRPPRPRPCAGGVVPRRAGRRSRMPITRPAAASGSRM